MEKSTEKSGASSIKMLSDPRFTIRPLQQVYATTVGAMITAILMTPLDVIKTRMQCQKSPSHKCFLYCNGLMDHLFACGLVLRPKPHFSSTWDAFLKISRSEGIRSLWSGLGPTLISALPSTVVYFVAYEQFRQRFLAFYYEQRNKRTSVQPIHNMPLFIPMLSGITARICAVSFVSPIELVRTKMQSKRLSYAQTLRFVGNVLEVQGFWGLWRGLPPTILRDVPFSAVYWPVYEYLKSHLSDKSPPSFGCSFLSGVLAGSAASLITTPFDVIKTHEQIEFGERVIFADTPKAEVSQRSVYKRLADIYSHHGVRGLFTGIGPRLLRVAPACAIMISTFEYSKTYFFYYNIERHNKALLMDNPKAKLITEKDFG